MAEEFIQDRVLLKIGLGHVLCIFSQIATGIFSTAICIGFPDENKTVAIPGFLSYFNDMRGNSLLSRFVTLRLNYIWTRFLHEASEEWVALNLSARDCSWFACISLWSNLSLSELRSGKKEFSSSSVYFLIRSYADRILEQYIVFDIRVAMRTRRLVSEFGTAVLNFQYVALITARLDSYRSL